MSCLNASTSLQSPNPHVGSGHGDHTADGGVCRVWCLCRCFDTGIVRSVRMYEQVGLLKAPIHISLVMGVASGMPAKPE